MDIRNIVPIASLVVIFTLEGFLPFFKGRKQRIAHAIPNIFYGIASGVITGLLFAGMTFWLLGWNEKNSSGILNWTPLPVYMRFLVAFLLFDLWMYIWHFMLHRIIFLWKFHRVHHSDLEMDSTTALRFHPGEILFSTLLRLLVIPVIGLSISQFILYNLVLSPVILFHHSNINLPEKYDRILRMFIVTPNMHRVHHSIEWKETNSNYGSIFSFWDRLWKTFIRRADPEKILFGLRIFREPKWQSIWGMLVTPFR